MGVSCSRVEKEETDHVGQIPETPPRPEQAHSKLVRRHLQLNSRHRADAAHSNTKAMDTPYETVAALDVVIDARAPKSEKRKKTVIDRRDKDATSFASVEDYFAQRGELKRREDALSFQHRCRVTASDCERRVNGILQSLREKDKATVYDAAEKRVGYGGQAHDRFPGDHYLSNVDLIENTELFRIAQRMPKGAHLHIHFNACLKPNVLLSIAAGMEHMYITSDLPLVPDNDYLNYFRCEIQFSILPREKATPGHIFSPAYVARQTMNFQQFIQEFPQNISGVPVMRWLEKKLMFQEEEANGILQTSKGAWEKFNGKTRMMKGLFNYESAYRQYTRLCLKDFVADNIQYAEIRPNFMKTNQLWTDDGTRQIDNVGIMNIIIEEYQAFQAENDRYFGGLKVIYCTPRSFSNELVKYALDECMVFKKRWPEWIAGFDLVGEEAKGRPLKDFVPEFLEFRKQCNADGLDIPFLFHCGETLELGTDVDGNLIDALLQGAKRIGHGFALAAHPYILEQMKKQNVCLEVCPISNEILGLANRVNGHSMYSLLARDVHCTVNSDNGTLFRSTLSHDFYQVMVGRADMTLYGWRQLIEWSLQHACMSEEEHKDVYANWLQAWNEFLQWVLDTYGGGKEVGISPLNGQ